MVPATWYKAYFSFSRALIYKIFLPSPPSSPSLSLSLLLGSSVERGPGSCSLLTSSHFTPEEFHPEGLRLPTGARLGWDRTAGCFKKAPWCLLGALLLSSRSVGEDSPGTPVPHDHSLQGQGPGFIVLRLCLLSVLTPEVSEAINQLLLVGPDLRCEPKEVKRFPKRQVV